MREEKTWGWRCGDVVCVGGRWEDEEEEEEEAAAVLELMSACQIRNTMHLRQR